MAINPATIAPMIATAKGGSINTGIWTLVSLGTVIVGAISTVMVAWIRQKGPWAKNASEARAIESQRVADERASDFQRLRDEIREIRNEAREARDTSRRLEAANACMRPAISILMAEVRRLDPNPNNQALLEAQTLMEMAAAGDFGVGRAMAALANVKDHDE